MDEKTERRENSRGKIYIRTELKLNNNAITACYTSNVSSSGCFIVIDDIKDFPKQGDEIELSLFLDNQEKNFNASGEVQRIEEDGIAIKFINYDLELIHQLMNTQPAEMKLSSNHSSKQDKITEKPGWFFYLIFTFLLSILGAVLYFLFMWSV
jgi:hypothetical protein